MSLVSNSFAVKVSQPINTDENWIVTNVPLKGDSTNYPQINDYFTNVLNIYTQFEGDVLIASNSLPTYPNTSLNPDNRQITFGSQDVNTIITIEDHGFFTGDGVFSLLGPLHSPAQLQMVSLKRHRLRVNSGVLTLVFITSTKLMKISSHFREIDLTFMLVSLSNLLQMCWLKITHSHSIRLLVKVLMHNQSSDNLLIQ